MNEEFEEQIDWGQREREKLKEARWWASVHPWQINGKPFQNKTLWEVSNGVKILYKNTSIWRVCNWVMEQAPFSAGHDKSDGITYQGRAKRINYRKQEALTMLEEFYAALEPKTEDEFLGAIAESNYGDISLARHVFRSNQHN